MTLFSPKKLHVTFLPGTRPDVFSLPRKYTLTHSDRTGDLYLTVGSEYHLTQLEGVYTRFMRDEVLGEWRTFESGYELHIVVHVSGGLVFGTARYRNRILKRELPLALQAIRYGDGYLFDARPDLDSSEVIVHFEAKQAKYNRVESMGRFADYRTVKPAGRR